jgi:hypothetical protein
MTAIAEFANLSLVEVRPGMLSASDFDTPKLDLSPTNPVMCTPLACPAFVEGMAELLVAAVDVYEATQKVTNG